MQIDGFALLDQDDNVIDQWYTIPSQVHLPTGDVVFNASVDWTNGTYHISAHSWTDTGIPIGISFISLMSLFTPEEQLAIVGSGDAGILLFLLKAASSQTFLNDANFQTTLASLVSKALISSQRAQEIAANIVQ